MQDCDNKPSFSFIKMSSTELTRQVQNKFVWIKEQKSLKLKTLIVQKKTEIIISRQKVADRFWNKLLGRSEVGNPLPSDEEIINLIESKEHPMFGETQYIKHMYYKTEEKLNQLYAAAQSATEIFVSIDDLKYLK